MLFHGEKAIDVCRGVDPYYSQVHIRGRNADIDIGSEDVWDGGGDYNLFTAAALVHVSSSNGADTQTLTIVGLDANGVVQTKEVTLAGQVETAITGNPTWKAIHSVTIDSAPAGDVYVYEDDTITAGVPDTATKIRAKIVAGNTRTYMAIYMIPAGKEGYLVEYDGSHAGIQAWVITALGGTAEWLENLNGYRQAPVLLASGTLIKFRYTSAAINQDVRAAATIILRKSA